MKLFFLISIKRILGSYFFIKYSKLKKNYVKKIQLLKKVLRMKLHVNIEVYVSGYGIASY
jgi:hypothetical protein